LEAAIAAREEAGEAVTTFAKASVNALNSRGGSPEFLLGESDDDGI
jgi:hypothetical protein